MKGLKLLALFLLILTACITTTVACGDCEHQWDEGYVAKEATENEAGQKVFTCTLCGESKSEEIAKIAHTKHDYTKTTWGYDEKNHWLVCDYKDCGAATGKGIHLYSDASKDDGLICIICRSSSNAHTFTDNIAFDNDFHWLECDEADCPTKKARAYHTLDESGSCTGCPYSTTSKE